MLWVVALASLNPPNILVVETSERLQHLTPLFRTLCMFVGYKPDCQCLSGKAGVNYRLSFALPHEGNVEVAVWWKLGGPVPVLFLLSVHVFLFLFFKGVCSLWTRLVNVEEFSI